MPNTIFYIHTSHVLIPLFTELTQRILSGAEQYHMVDESLIKHTIRDNGLTETTTRRVVGMVQLAREGGADAVVVTCSSIGPAATVAQSQCDFPVIRIDDAMAEQAVCTGKRIGVAATLRTTLEPTLALLRSKAAVAHKDVVLVESLCADAFEAVLSGDTESHDRLLSKSLLKLMSDVDVVVLAQASMARVVQSLPNGSIRVPVLSSPELAVRQARAKLSPGGPVRGN